MYVQLFVFTFLTSVMFKTFRFIECALSQKSLTQHFYRRGEREWKRPWMGKHIPSRAERAKQEAFFFFHSTWPSSHNTPAQKHTVTHQHSHSLLSLNGCGNVSDYFWVIFQYRLVMHVHTETVTLSFSVLLVPVTAAGRGSSTAPTGRGLMGMLLLKPHILGPAMVCQCVLSSRSSFC